MIIIEICEPTQEMITIEFGLKLIENALSNIEQSYFKISTSGNSDEIIRERVFCYELYHQMRLVQKNNYEFSIHAEIDKRGNSSFETKHWKNPDFIFHKPGENSDNIIICEVKGKIESKGIKKDFETISTFIKKYNYKVGVFILYGYLLEELKDCILSNRKEFYDCTKEIKDSIYIFIKETAEAQIKKIRYSELFKK